jgi:di- and tripeptidase
VQRMDWLQLRRHSHLSTQLWQITPQPKLLHTFAPHQGGVLSVVVSSTGLVFAGSQDGQIKVWDLETRTLVRTLVAQENVDVLSLSVLGAEVYACSANGYVQVSSFLIVVTNCDLTSLE